MIGHVHRTPCPDCRHDVPAGRWCNWCGAGLGAPRDERAVPRVPVGVMSSGAAALIVAGAALVGWGSGADPGPPPAPPAAVVLPEEVPAPRPGRSIAVPDRGPPVERVAVICSDLRVRSVPVTDVATDVPGELVELANGTCVVMAPEGVVVP